jgi:RHS repeat-associated protein
MKAEESAPTSDLRPPTSACPLSAIGGDSLAYDNNGNLATGAGLTLGYDAHPPSPRLRRARGRLISAATATNAVSFIYDGRNRCVARTTVTATSGSTVWLVWGHEQSAHWGLLEERDADGDLVARYVHGDPASSRAARNYAGTRGIDEILRREAGASTVFYHHDALGSTIALTDASGALVEQYRYDVYGLRTIMDASGADLGSRTSALGNRFMFTGREWIAEIGLYDHRNRAYSPILGRWLQPDPIGFAAGDVNLHRYCGNLPLTFVDATGFELAPSWGSPGTIFGAKFGGLSDLPSAIGEVAGDIWNSPNTVLGLGLGGVGVLLGGDLPTRNDKVITFLNNPVLDYLPPAAITLGVIINYAPGYYPATKVPRYDERGWVTLDPHERAHVPQERNWGPFFILAYLLSDLWPGVNPFEQSADNAATFPPAAVDPATASRKSGK